MANYTGQPWREQFNIAVGVVRARRRLTIPPSQTLPRANSQAEPAQTSDDALLQRAATLRRDSGDRQWLLQNDR